MFSNTNGQKRAIEMGTKISIKLKCNFKLKTIKGKQEVNRKKLEQKYGNSNDKIIREIADI